MTLARRHFQRTSAAAASATADAGEPINANAYELQLTKLYADKRRLKDVQSIARKIEVKRQILPDYAPWIDGALEGGRGGQDAVLMTVMVWRIDTDDFAGALQIAAYALAHGLVMPDQFQRDVATLVAEEISDRALQTLSTGGGFALAVLERTEQLTRGHDMPDEVRAKLHKALGLAESASIEGAAHPAAVAAVALDHFRRALQLHDRVGVKKNIEQLERFLKHHPGSDVAHANAAGDGRDILTSQRSAVASGAAGEAGHGPPGAPPPPP